VSNLETLPAPSNIEPNEYDVEEIVYNEEWEEFKEDFADTEEEFISAVELIKGGIEEGRWTSLIADDARGRIPALVIRGVMSRAYQEHGLKTPHLNFLAGARSVVDRFNNWSNPDEVEEASNQYSRYLDLLKSQGPGRRLIITEHIDHGRNVGIMLKQLKHYGIEADVLTFSIRDRQGASQLETENLFVVSSRENGDERILEGLMDGLKGGRYQYLHLPLNKVAVGTEGNPVEYKGEKIPVAHVHDPELYRKMAALCDKMAEDVYQETFHLETDAS
jgi:hypothetical protein